jgi:hypothetical protein
LASSLFQEASLSNQKKKNLPLYLSPPISMSLAYNESSNKPNLLVMEEEQQQQQELT